MCQLYLIKTEKKNRNLSFVVLVVINIRNVKKKCHFIYHLSRLQERTVLKRVLLPMKQSLGDTWTSQNSNHSVYQSFKR